MAFNVIVFEGKHKRTFLQRDYVPFLKRSEIVERNKFCYSFVFMLIRPTGLTLVEIFC